MSIKKGFVSTLSAIAMVFFTALPALADDSADVAKKLANPVASLISVPVDFDFDWNLGPREDGMRTTIVAKPVIPFTLNDRWNLISRVILPWAGLNDLAPGVDDASGLADIQTSFFFSPKEPYQGIIWGAGPIMLFPTATDDLLGEEKWGAGPTAVALKQRGSWTYGMLANHLWSYAGSDDRENVNRSFIQPFVSYTTSAATTFSLQSESNYNWKTDDWSIPIQGIVSQVAKLGPQLIQLKAGVRYWAASPDGVGPEGWGVKTGIVFLFPK